MRVGIVIALDAEARTIARRDGVFLDQGSYQVRVSGPGPARAEAAARHLLAAGCDALLSFGLAGGLAPTLRPGALLVAASVHSAHGTVMHCDATLREALLARLAHSGAQAASIYGADAPLVAHADKRNLHERLGVAVVDMESAAIARVAELHGKPFGALRCVVDPADFSLPRAALAGMRDDGGSRPLATVAALLLHPLELPDLIRLALWYGGALRALRGAATQLCG